MRVRHFTRRVWKEGSTFVKTFFVRTQKGLYEFFLFYGALLLVACSLFCLVFAHALYAAFIPSDTLRVTFFDVGQGDGILIESGSKTKVLIDGGPSTKVLTKITNELSFFDRQIDYVSPSHADKDHITGSIAALDTFPVENVSLLHASSATELDDEYDKRMSGKAVRRSLAADTIDLGSGAKLTVLLPYEGEKFSEKETNDSSSVLLLTHKQFSFLLTGDLPESREHMLVTSGLLPRDLTVLKLGHHGSKYSSGNELLSYAMPKYAIVSDGKDNRYGHPSKETLDRVTKAGSRIFSTIDNGDITFEIRDGQLRVSTER